MNSYPKKIKQLLNNELPGNFSHKKMVPQNRKLIAPEGKKQSIKHSSVLLPLFSVENELMICLIKRPPNMKYHAGQVALPGGKIELGETAMQTALRETNEEIGIEAEEIEILGSLSELYVEVSNFLIQPFVGWLKNKPEFLLNKDEVEKIILFPLKNFRNRIITDHLETINGKLKVPCLHFENEIIWGATAMILMEFYDILKATFFIGE